LWPVRAANQLSTYLSHGEVSRDEVLLLVDGGDVGLVGLLADNLDNCDGRGQRVATAELERMRGRRQADD
jgi:hypothetical protein